MVIFSAAWLLKKPFTANMSLNEPFTADTDEFTRFYCLCYERKFGAKSWKIELTTWENPWNFVITSNVPWMNPG